MKSIEAKNKNHNSNIVQTHNKSFLPDFEPHRLCALRNLFTADHTHSQTWMGTASHLSAVHIDRDLG